MLANRSTVGPHEAMQRRVTQLETELACAKEERDGLKARVRELEDVVCAMQSGFSFEIVKDPASYDKGTRCWSYTMALCDRYKILACIEFKSVSVSITVMDKKILFDAMVKLKEHAGCDSGCKTIRTGGKAMIDRYDAAYYEDDEEVTLEKVKKGPLCLSSDVAALEAKHAALLEVAGNMALFIRNHAGGLFWSCPFCGREQEGDALNLGANHAKGCLFAAYREVVE